MPIVSFGLRKIRNEIVIRIKNNIKLWSFQMNWDDYNRSNKYDIEFYSNRNLYELNKELFAPDLSTIRTGWKARYEINSDGMPERVKVMDALGNLFYFYEFTYITWICF
mgnify:CR=1 FL=1